MTGGRYLGIRRGAARRGTTPQFCLNLLSLYDSD